MHRLLPFVCLLACASAVRTARLDERKFSPDPPSKHLLRTLVKLLFGADEEPTSRQILQLLASVLDMLKGSLGQQRSATGGWAAASASLLKGYLRAALANSTSCAHRHLCEASQEAVRDGREVGYLIAQIGGYAASSALESGFQENYSASRRGRSGEDCAFHACANT